MSVSNKKTILLSNDDGFSSPGLIALAKALQSLGRVVVVAPATDQSAVSHGISLKKSLKLKEQLPILGEGGPIEVYSVDGTPADAVYMGLFKILDTPPDLVVAGINHGANLGKDVIYSGTVAAAVEAALNGFPAAAFSLVNRTDEWDFSGAAHFAQAYCKMLLNATDIPRGMVFNVNVPNKIKENTYAISSLGVHDYEQSVEERKCPRGESYYWIGGTLKGFETLPGTDWAAISCGQISVTPLRPQYFSAPETHWMAQQEVAQWQGVDAVKFGENES